MGYCEIIRGIMRFYRQKSVNDNDQYAVQLAEDIKKAPVKHTAYHEVQ